MTRREALRMLACGAALHLAPARTLAAMREARAALGIKPTNALRTLDAHQHATVRAMAELILPRTETPGATDVGVAEFIDLMLTEWYDDADRTRFAKGLADVDARTQELFGKNFADSSPVQQGEILTVLGEELMSALQRRHDRGIGDDVSVEREEFYPMFRRLALTGYYTSERGASDELHFEIIPSSHDECVQITTDAVTERE